MLRSLKWIIFTWIFPYKYPSLTYVWLETSRLKRSHEKPAASLKEVSNWKDSPHTAPGKSLHKAVQVCLFEIVIFNREKEIRTS